ncbi:MAG: DUF1801 domain-containing protein [Xanthomonadales bacterium]|jgi:hypothetical protein|nr:DUF1801 domain-containing protein [Xanthomonadales bacterium]
MPAKSVQSLVDDVRLVSEANYALVEAVRRAVREQFPDVAEAVKYGGILFSVGVPFAGVFAYKAHVSVEFGRGADIVDPFGWLEGQGKGRRHITLTTLGDIACKQLAAYLPLARRAADAHSSVAMRMADTSKVL